MFAAILPKFIELENRPPNTLDLNRVDYSVWECYNRWCIIKKFLTWSG